MKSTIFKLHCIVIVKPHPLKTLTVAFFFLSISGFETFWNIPRPSSRYKAILDLFIMDVSLFKMNEPTNSHTPCECQIPSVIYQADVVNNSNDK